MPTTTMRGSRLLAGGRPLEWFMFLRVVLVTAILSLALFIRAQQSTEAVDLLRADLLYVIVGTYLLTIAYALVLRSGRVDPVRFAYAQLTVDLGVSALVVSLTGGTESMFNFLYLLAVLSGALLLLRRGASYLSLGAAILIGLQVVRELVAASALTPEAAAATRRASLLGGLVNVSAVVCVGLLASYLGRQLRDVNRRLDDADRRLHDTTMDLASLKALNAHIITSIQSGLISYTLDHRVIFFNPAAARITGLAEVDTLLTDARAIFPHLGTLNTDEAEPRFEIDYLGHPDGQRRTLGLNLSRLVDGSGAQQGWILVFQDLTPLREMQATVRRSEQLAAIGALAAGIAHEIRNPLAGMSSSIQMLQRSLSLDAVQTRLMAIVQREADRLDHLITDFLRYARPGVLEPAPLDLGELLREVVTMFRSGLGLPDPSPADRSPADRSPADPSPADPSPADRSPADRRPADPSPAEPSSADVSSAEARPALEVRLTLDGDLRLVADGNQLRQVVWNLLRNAAEAMEHRGRIDVIARQLPAAGPHGPRVGFQVVDRGPGLPADQLDRIFEPFYTTKDRGTGLGLPMVARIIDDHRGSVRVESEPGRGSTFVVVLPVVVATSWTGTPPPLALGDSGTGWTPAPLAVAAEGRAGDDALPLPLERAG